MENIEEIKKRIDDAKKQKDDATRKYYEAERKLDGIKSEIEYYQRMIKEAGQLIKTHTDHYDRVFEDRRRNININTSQCSGVTDNGSVAVDPLSGRSCVCDVYLFLYTSPRSVLSLARWSSESLSSFPVECLRV